MTQKYATLISQLHPTIVSQPAPQDKTQTTPQVTTASTTIYFKTFYAHYTNMRCHSYTAHRSLCTRSLSCKYAHQLDSQWPQRLRHCTCPHRHISCAYTTTRIDHAFSILSAEHPQRQPSPLTNIFTTFLVRHLVPSLRSLTKDCGECSLASLVHISNKSSFTLLLGLAETCTPFRMFRAAARNSRSGIQKPDNNLTRDVQSLMGRSDASKSIDSSEYIDDGM
jgi:hypothetical protein